jgi:YwiC-like protein
VLLPKEHGAYGQLALPVVTALSAAGVSYTGLLLTASAVAAFVAHEPAAILLGLRGARARREHHGAAIRCLAFCVGITVTAGAMSLLTIQPEVRWSIAVPIAPAILLGIATVRGREKSWYGELLAALALAGLAVPLSMAAGASLNAAAAVAVPFVILFITSTLAVRTVILRVRAGGNARAAAVTRRSAFTVTAVAAVCLVWLASVEVLPVSTLAAATPALLTALVITTRPPQPTHLRIIGWTLVAVSVLTSVIVVATR